MARFEELSFGDYVRRGFTVTKLSVCRGLVHVCANSFTTGCCARLPVATKLLPSKAGFFP